MGLQVLAAVTLDSLLMSSGAFTSRPGPHNHVCGFRIRARAAKARLLFSLSGKGSKITSAAFSFGQGQQNHVCCFHYRAKAAKSRLLLSLSGKGSKITFAAFTFGQGQQKSPLLLSLSGKGNKITSAAFTFGQGQQNHVCPLHGLLGKLYWLPTCLFAPKLHFITAVAYPNDLHIGIEPLTRHPFGILVHRHDDRLATQKHRIFIHACVALTQCTGLGGTHEHVPVFHDILGTVHIVQDKTCPTAVTRSRVSTKRVSLLSRRQFFPQNVSHCCHAVSHKACLTAVTQSTVSTKRVSLLSRCQKFPQNVSHCCHTDKGFHETENRKKNC